MSRKDLGEKSTDLDALAVLWRSQHLPRKRTIEEEVMEVKKKAKQFERTLFWRDVREGVALAFAVAVMGSVSAMAPGWIPKLGAVAVAVIGVWVWRRLTSGRRQGPRARPGAPLAESLRIERDKVEHQIGLLESVTRWYTAPLALAGTLWLTSLVPALGLPLPVALLAVAFSVVASLSIFALTGIAVARLNRLALERDLLPRRDELTRLIQSFDPG